MSKTAHKPLKAPQGPQQLPAANETSITLEALLAALKPVCERLDRIVELLPVAARLAQADTRQTMEQPETVLKRAVKEGRLAAEVISETQTDKEAKQ